MLAFTNFRLHERFIALAYFVFINTGCRFQRISYDQPLDKISRVGPLYVNDTVTILYVLLLRWVNFLTFIINFERNVAPVPLNNPATPAPLRVMF